MDKLVSANRLSLVPDGAVAPGKRRKRVLVVDDSLTVRELERKLLGNRGYEVEVAVDGMDGWNAVRTGHFDLVISDIDMPRMDGIELVTLINKDPNLKSVPVMVVSYKDRDEDRRRGLDAGAAYYLTKGSFHDETLLNAVVDLIGEAIS
jgi:two-component system sensor histidine kinase and response regulator WspE